MHSLERNVISSIKTAVLAEYDTADVVSEYVREPSSFPHVSVVEADNYMVVGALDSSDKERYSANVYEINVYSNRTSGKKSECRKIMGIIDDIMYSLNFRRTAMTPVPNLENSSIYRITARYSGVTDGNTFYRI